MADRSGEMAQLMAQSEKLYMSHLLTGNLDDIHEAVRCAQSVFEQKPAHDAPMVMARYGLARSLFRRFLATRKAEDIAVAMDIFRQLSQSPSHLVTDVVRQKCAQYLIVSQFVQDDNFDAFLKLNALDVLSQSLTSSLQIENLTHSFEEEELYCYLESTLFESERRLRFQSNAGDLDSAIDFCRMAMLYFSRSSNSRIVSTIFFNQGIFMRFRFSQQGSAEDNYEAVSCFCSALRVGLPLHLVGPCLTFACNSLIDRYMASRQQEDLDNAFDYIQQAKKMIEATDQAMQSTKMGGQNSHGIVACLDNLARIMRLRYMGTGDLHDLNSAIDASGLVVEIIEAGHPRPDFPKFLEDLAEHVKLRIQRTRQAEDVRWAIETLQKSVGLRPRKHPRRVQSLINLSFFEGMQARKLPHEAIEHGERTAQHLQEAFSLCEQDVLLRRGLDMNFLESMETFLLSNFMDFKWSEQAETLARSNVVSEFQENPLGNFSLAILYSCYLNRWHNTLEIEELDRTIAIARSMGTAAHRTPDCSISALIRLGHCLYERYRNTGDRKNGEEAVAVLLKGFQTTVGTPSYRMRAGKAGIEILSELRAWVGARTLCREMINLLVIANDRSLDWQGRQLWLQQFSSQAALYASIALKAGSDAWDVIDLLETCRCAILDHVVCNWAGLENLNEVAPEKAKCFRILQGEINAVIDPSGNANIRMEQITRRGKSDGEIRACLQDIRNLEGFHRFLLGPSQEEITAAAAGGPILIVNISSIRSDAIIVTKDHPILVPLNGMKYQEAREYVDADLTNPIFGEGADLGKMNTKFRQLQKWLWDNCVKIILDKLEDLDLLRSPAKLHVWWIGIGVARSLPFHAAGVYTPGEDPFPETALSRVISSYTPTLKALITGRRNIGNHALEPNKEESTKIAIITVPSTSCKTDPEFAVKESEAILKVVSNAYSPTVISRPDAEAAKKLVRQNEITHFGGHSASSLINPSTTHLHLQTRVANFAASATFGKLKARGLPAINVGGQLVFLSTHGKPTGIWDEVLSLPSGFQAAGFSHAVGDLWGLDDEKHVDIVGGFYRRLVSTGELGYGENVASALNDVILEFASRFASDPLSWAPFVHFGI